jgi:2-oxoglutarate dehydrogenase E2 component (dihydrolipoamide succinyltransferase)
MAVELKVPSVGESITEVEIGEWLKQEGAFAKQDEPIVVIETEKATLEVPAPVSGKVTQVLKKQGEHATVGEVVGYMEQADAEQPAQQQTTNTSQPAAKPEPPPQQNPATPKAAPQEAVAPPEAAAPPVPAAPAPSAPPAAPSAPPPPVSTPGRVERIVPMTAIRRRIAERLVEARQNAALLTTFNEIEMSAVATLREKYQDAFQKKYNVKLGLMSFFVKASVEALRKIPEINAEIRDESILYRDYYDIGIAIGGGKGLVVPVIRNAERLTFAEIEKQIIDFADRARESHLKVEELQGGTFTISNGGIYGSLLSTPIVNPPQSGVLGLHAIEDRPVVRGGEIVARPMMYVALTYDHRIVDGREAVTFLKHIKELIEDPTRILLEI